MYHSNRGDWSSRESSHLVNSCLLFRLFVPLLVPEKGESERRVIEDHVGREMSENRAASGAPVAHAFKTLPVGKRELKKKLRLTCSRFPVEPLLRKK